MHGARLHKTSRRDAMPRDPRRDLLGRDQDILLRDRDETLVRLETVSRTRRLDRDHIPAAYVASLVLVIVEASVRLSLVPANLSG